MNIKTFLNNSDTLDGINYEETLVKAYDYFDIPFPTKIYSIKNTDIKKFYHDNSHGWARSIDDIYNGIYLLSNLIYYHNVRNLWRRMASDEDLLIRKVSYDLLHQGFTLIKIENNEPFKISLSNKLNLLFRFILSGCAHRDIKTNFFPSALEIVSKIYSKLYMFNDNLVSNLQLVASGVSPNRSEFPEVYEWHYDLPYPNLKSFFNPYDLLETNGPYSYIPKSNIYSTEKAILLIASGLAKFDEQKNISQNINIVSNFYKNYKTKIYIPSIMEEIRKRERVVFDLPKNYLVITDNFGLHRKTAGFWGLKYFRTYIHPVPYPRANEKFFNEIN